MSSYNPASPVSMLKSIELDEATGPTGGDPRATTYPAGPA